jgi:hypothetical protein
MEVDNELAFSDVLDVLADWKGREVSVFVSADGGFVHPIAVLYGVLGALKMSSAVEYEKTKGVAAYEIGGASGFAIDSEAFDLAWTMLGRLFVNAAGVMLQIDPDGVRLPWGADAT